MTISEPSDELVERVARALSVPQHHTGWDHLPEMEKDLFYMQADYALKALGLSGEEPLIDLITGRPVEDWVEDLMDEREVNRVVKSVTEAFRAELKSIMAKRNARAAIAAMPDLTDRVRRLEEALKAIAAWDQGIGVAAMKSIARTALGEPQC